MQLNIFVKKLKVYAVNAINDQRVTKLEKVVGYKRSREQFKQNDLVLVYIPMLKTEKMCEVLHCTNSILFVNIIEMQDYLLKGE